MIVRKAFTVMEVVLMAAVFAVIASSAVAGFSTSRGSARLRGSAQELMTNVKKAQAYSYANTVQNLCSDNLICGSGSSCDGNPSSCVKTPIMSYGISLDPMADGKEYIVFADVDGDGAYRVGEALPNGEVTLPLNISISSVSPSADKVFTYSYGAPSSKPFTSCTTDCVTSIVLTDAQTGRIRTIEIQKQSGTISIQ
jgi:type II secretory pathway pseudopilin PulG